ncbi:MAG: regulatory protein RecX [Coprococcus sp.]
MRITAIEYVSRHKMRVSLDGEPAFVLTDKKLEEWQLHVGDDLDDERSEALMTFVGREAARAAMDLLIRRDYSEAELYSKLRQKGFNDRIAAQGIAYVHSYHYLDDERYASQLVAGKRGTVSRKMMICQLQQKGVDDTVIQKTMACAEWNDEDGIRFEIRKKFHSSEELFELSEKDRQKMFQSLMRKGYNYSDISRIMRNFVDVDI